MITILLDHLQLLLERTTLEVIVRDLTLQAQVAAVAEVVASVVEVVASAEAVEEDRLAEEEDNHQSKVKIYEIATNNLFVANKHQ
jgi:hypothetical protein